MKRLFSVLIVALIALTGLADDLYGPFGRDSDIAEDVQQCTPTVYDVTLTIRGKTAKAGDCIAAYRTSDNALCGLGMVYDAGTSGIKCDLVLYSFKDAKIHFKVWQCDTPATSAMILDADPSCDIVAPAPGTIGFSALNLFVAQETFSVTFVKNANEAIGTMAAQTFTADLAQALHSNAFTRAGYTFAGWATSASGNVVYTDGQSIKVSAAMTLYAKWTANTYFVTFNANGGSGTMAAQMFTADVAQALRANAFTRAGYTFAGWATNASGNVVYNDGQSIKVSAAITLYAQWTPEQKPVQHNDFKLYTNDETDLNLSEASTWEGWLEKDGVALGTIFVKLSKVDSSGHVKLAATIQKVGARKEKVEFRISPMNGAVDTVGTINGLVCKCKGNTLSGSYDGCEIKGARNLFASKVATDKAAVAAVSAKWGKVVNVILEDKYSLSIGSKGKVNVTGFFADGAKDTTKAQMIVGADWCAIPVMFTKKHKIAFVVWLPMKQGEPDVQIDIGPDAIVGKPGNMTGEYCFAAYFYNPFVSHYISGAEVLEEYIPCEEKVTMSGNRLVVSKPGKLKWDARNAEIVETGDGNFAALKISCKAATGVFTGTFKIWSQSDSGRIKATSVKFNGVMVEDFGSGWAKPKNAEVLDVYLYRPEDD